MATDQGKTANVTALAVLAGLTGRDIPATGTTTFRPPYVPVPIAALGAGGAGRGFAPRAPARRRTTAIAALGAPFVEAGLWYPAGLVSRRRARRPGARPATARSAWCARRSGSATSRRSARSTCRGRTRGRFSTGSMPTRISTLPVGRVRYGLMLREDGFVMDDGTVARLGAGALRAHHHHRGGRRGDGAPGVLRPGASGPGSTCRRSRSPTPGRRSRWRGRGRASSSTACSRRRSMTRAFPFMACGAARIAGVAGRLFRISFSGEHGLRAGGAGALRGGALGAAGGARPRRSAAGPTGWRR